jgi:hypothetical protein
VVHERREQQTFWAQGEQEFTGHSEARVATEQDAVVAPVAYVPAKHRMVRIGADQAKGGPAREQLSARRRGRFL